MLRKYIFWAFKHEALSTFTLVFVGAGAAGLAYLMLDKYLMFLILGISIVLNIKQWRIEKIKGWIVWAKFDNDYVIRYDPREERPFSLGKSFLRESGKDPTFCRVGLPERDVVKMYENQQVLTDNRGYVSVEADAVIERIGEWNPRELWAMAPGADRRGGYPKPVPEGRNHVDVHISLGRRFEEVFINHLQQRNIRFNDQEGLEKALKEFERWFAASAYALCGLTNLRVRSIRTRVKNG